VGCGANTSSPALPAICLPKRCCASRALAIQSRCTCV
jgi:hypothetical protein